jgi:hypothetical protein
MSKLNVLDTWANGVSAFFMPKSAQGYLKPAMAVAGSCGSSCGTGDDGKKKEEPKPGASCGAGDDGNKKEQPKPSACGAGDDAGKSQK